MTMSATPSKPNDIDRKLHRIILDSNASDFTDMMSLAKHIESQKPTEFSYFRDGRTRFSGAETIREYISYASAVGLLDPNLAPTRPKKDVRSLESFQQWLSDTVFQYLATKGCAITQIANKIPTLFSTSPYRLPTLGQVRSLFATPPSPRVFRHSLRIMALLRPNAIQVKSSRVILIPGTVEE
jgi:hypothetical protein